MKKPQLAPSGLLSVSVLGGTEDRDGEELVEYPGWEEGHGARRVNIKELNEITKNRLKRALRREL